MALTECKCTERNVITSLDDKPGAYRAHQEDANGVWCCVVVPTPGGEIVHPQELIAPSSAYEVAEAARLKDCADENAAEESKRARREALRAKARSKETFSNDDICELCAILLGD